ncbi:MAG TPA: CpsD/CapB family tyrosine-protein kinase [Bryobacteraceae bacterium]|jgi:receptor protein-tyrosine kinase|nr:CpsD/CapB family tyrosine-protein kinase [Bryobacteraceae bacterium]
MSRVHDALRRAESQGLPVEAMMAPVTTPERPHRGYSHGDGNGNGNGHGQGNGNGNTPGRVKASSQKSPFGPELLEGVQVVPFQPALESHLLDLDNNPETPAEEFRTLRTRVNHLATLQPLHTVIVTSPSPAEGKTFTAVNLALAESQLSENLVLLGDFDLRRPIVHNLFQIDRAPGLSDFLTGECSFTQALRKVEGTNLYLLPAGSAVKNPLELLNMRQAKRLFEDLPSCFNWAIFDTPPLLFSADANLLATLADGTILVVKIGSTTFDNVTRAMQSLCENNVLGIVANGARASELYSKYTYYYSKAD